MSFLERLGLAPARKLVEAQATAAVAEVRIHQARREGFKRGMSQYGGYAAANISSRLMNFNPSLNSPNREVKRDLRTLRAHSRTLPQGPPCG